MSPTHGYRLHIPTNNRRKNERAGPLCQNDGRDNDAAECTVHMLCLIHTVIHHTMYGYSCIRNYELYTGTEYVVCMIDHQTMMYQPGKVANPARGELNRED